MRIINRPDLMALRGKVVTMADDAVDKTASMSRPIRDRLMSPETTS
jgi:hypothetical protein